MIALPLRLALRELRHDWAAAACFVAALVGVLAPLLVLLALKNGVITAMVDGLVDDPSNREVLPVGAGRFDTAFFAAMQADPRVAFVVPATRSINAAANAIRNPQTRKLERAVALIPSAEGDPLIAGAPVGPGRLHLSATLAQALGAEPGDSVEMVIGREIDGARQLARRDMSVTSIVSQTLYGRDAAFVALPDLLAIERFRDDAAMRAEDWVAAGTAPEAYAGFRLYVRDLSDLEPVLAELSGRDIVARARAENATLLLRFRDNLNLLYLGIAALAVAGFWAAMAANLRGMVERQRVVFSLLNMLGLSAARRGLVPFSQSIVLVLSGVLITLVIVAPVLALINLGFGDDLTGAVARLGAGDVAATLGLGLVTAVTAALWAARAAGDVDTAEVLRNG